MGTLKYQLFYQRHLPHLQPAGATLFITFRLAGSIPQQILQHLRAEAEQREATLARIVDPQERAQRADLEQRRLFGKWDKALDATPSGPFWLRDARIARLVTASLHYRNGRVYNLDTFCIMPNHIHLVCTPLAQADGKYHALSAMMHSLKRYTARQANLVLEREGSFWQNESYDHVVRNEAERRRIINYVLNNPVKAGLAQRWEEWPHTYCRTD